MSTAQRDGGGETPDDTLGPRDGDTTDDGALVRTETDTEIAEKLGVRDICLNSVSHFPVRRIWVVVKVVLDLLLFRPFGKYINAN